MPVNHINNGDGSVTQVDADTGQELVTFLDPDGSFTRDHIEPAAASAAQPAPRGANADRLALAAREVAPTETVTPDRTVVSPEPKLTPAQSEFQRHLAAKGVVERAGVSIPESPTPAPAARPAAAAPRPRMPAVAATEEGLSPESRAEAAASRERVIDANEQADIATTESEQVQLDAAAQRIQAESERRMGQAVADAELADLAQRKLGEAQEFSRQARAAPIRPQDALAGDKFFYAILANVGAALSNFGANLMGQRGMMDPNQVDDIIAASVQQQMAQKQLNVDAASEELGAARSEQLRREIRANASLEKWFEAQAQVEKLPETRAAYMANAQQRAAAREEKTRQLAEAEWTREAVQRQAPKPGAPPLNPETAEERGVLEANGVDDKAYRKYTDERVKTGADAFLSSADAAEQVVTKFSEGQDVKGSGPLDKLLQPFIRGSDGAAVQQTTGMLTAQFGKLISGASMTEGERAMLTGLIEGRGTLEDWKRGIGMLRRHADSQLETLNNGYPGEARSYAAIGKMRSGRKQATTEQQARRDAQLARSKDDRAVVARDESGKPFYESPEARRRREAAEQRESASRERRRGASNNDRARIGSALGLDD